MAKTKLTLTVNPDVIRLAKQYARRHRTSVSATFTRVMRTLASQEQLETVKAPPGSALQKLSGIINLPEGKTEDDVRFEALAEKFGLVAATKKT